MVEISKYPLRAPNGDIKGHMVVLRANPNSVTPVAELDAAVHRLVGNRGYNEFVESTLDNPWIRVVLFGINKIDFIEYDGRRIQG